MSVPSQTPYNIYTANGLTTVFAYQFMIMTAGDLDVSVNGISITGGFTVQGAGQTGGGQVVFSAPPANGAIVTLLRKLAIKRDTDYQDNGDLLAETINADFDRLWLAMQQAFLSDSLSLKRPLLGGPYNAGGLKIINLQDPTNPQDAATKGWVDRQYSVPTEEAKQAAEEAKAARDETVEIADKFGDVDTAITIAENAAETATGAAATATDAAARAEAIISGKGPFPTVEAGIAGTVSGEYFSHIIQESTGSISAFDFYLNNAGVAVYQTSMPATEYVNAVKALLQKSIRFGNIPGLYLALCDDAGWVGFQVDNQMGFGTTAAYLGNGKISAGNISLSFTSDSAIRLTDTNGFWVDVITNNLEGNLSKMNFPDGSGVTGTEDAILRVLDKNGFWVDIIDNDLNLLINGGGSGDGVDYVTIQDQKNKSYAAEVSRRVLTRLKFPTDAYNHFIMECQSLGMGFMCWPAVSQTPKYGNLMLGGSVRPASTTANTFTPIGGTAWQPLKAVVQSVAGSAILTDADQQALARSAVNEGESPIVGAVNGFRRHFLEAHCLNSDPSRLFVASTVGVSGQSIENLMDDTKYYNRVVECVAKAKALADGEGKTYSVTAIEFVQGEQNYANGTTKAAYKSLLGQLRNKLFSTIRGITGQTTDPAWFMYQTGFTYTPNPATQPLNAVELWVGMAQYEFCQENENCFMIGPNYQLPDKGGHLMTNGSRWLGCYFAKAKDRVLNQRRPFKPLAPIEFKCIGVDIFGSYYVDYPPLKFQSPFRGGVRTAIANKGFRVFSNIQNDPAGIGEEVSVVSVEIAADTIIKVSCATEPQGLIRVVYGMYQQYGQGMITDSDPYVPDEIYEYDPQFTQWPEENIAELIGKPYPMENWSIAFSYTFNKG
ncbi:TPA: hypothetical protein ACTYTZ_000878 [Klebsiella pneumoniae]